MKGIHGTSMQGIEYRTSKKGNKMCKDCKHLVANVVNRPEGAKSTLKKKDVVKRPPYKCEIKNKELYYTTKCYCNHFEQKEMSQNKMALLLKNRKTKKD